MKVIVILILIIILDSSWANLKCSKNPKIKLKYKNYSHVEFTSKFQRSNLTSSRNHFNFADIFPEMEFLAQHYSANITMGGGVPDELPPQFMLDALSSIVQNQTNANSNEIHQYTSMKGHPRLLNILAKFNTLLLKRKIDPSKEVLVTVGASNGLQLAMLTFLNKDEEVIVFEPFYSDYNHFAKFAGGNPVYVPLRVKKGGDIKKANDWSFDLNELESKITPKTKMIMLNNPNSPYGKEYTLNELTIIVQLANKYDLVIISDETGEWFQYDKPVHIKIGSLPGAFKRTVTINSGSKMFRTTGWRIGWAVGPEDLIWDMTAMAESVLCVSTPMQIAYAIGLEKEVPKLETPDSWWTKLRESTKIVRDKILYYLSSVGAEYVVPAAGYKILANFTNLSDQIDLSNERDCRPGMRFTRFLLKKGLLVYSGSLFFGPDNQWRTEYVIHLTTLSNLDTVDKFGQILFTIFRKTKK